MININTKLLEMVPERISPDQFYILLCLTKRIGKQKVSWPSIATLQKETGFGKNTVSRHLKALEEEGFITKEQRHKGGRLTSNIYTIKTNLIGVFISAADEQVEVEEDKPITVTQNEDTHFEDADFGSESINQVRSINQVLEVFEERAKSPGEIQFKSLQGHPVYAQQRSRKFPKLTDEDIILTLDMALVDNPRLTFANCINWLENEAAKKAKSEYRARSPGKGFTPKPIFTPYYRSYNTRAEYDADILHHRDKGFIVEVEALPSGACEYWGELEQSITREMGLIYKLVDPPTIDLNVRRSQLLE